MVVSDASVIDTGAMACPKGEGPSARKKPLADVSGRWIDRCPFVGRSACRH